MPIEIKELVVRASVVQQSLPSDTGCGPSPGGTARSSDGTTASGSSLTGDDREALIAASVREVLRILEQAKER